MKNKALMGLIAAATIGTAVAAPTIMSNQNSTHTINKILMVNNNTSNSATNEAVVINGNSNMNLYALSNGSGIVSKLSTGEMLTIVGNQQGNYCKVKVQETGAVGYINLSNMQNILNGTNASLTTLSESGQIVNVSSNVRLRSNPSISNNIITNLSNGTNLNILGKQGQWYKVSVNGQTGFIYEEYVSTNTSSVANANNGNQSSATSNSSSQSNSSTSSSNTGSISTNSNSSNNVVSSSSNSNSTANTNSNSHAKNIIVRTKSSKNTNTTNQNQSGITQVNKTVKIYLLGKSYINMSKTPTGNYYYEIPSGISTIQIISENSNDGTSYVECNGHYGYVNTKELNVGETNYTQMKDSNNTNSGNQGNNNNTNQSGITQVNKTVKIYLLGKSYINMSKTPTGNYYYEIPSGTSTIQIISENSNNGTSYVECNGHYGYVNTKELNVGETNYTQMKDSNSTNSGNQGNNNNTNQSGITQVNKTVKIYLLGKSYINMSKTPTGNYYYEIPSGTSTIQIISENSNDGTSYVECNGHYGYVNTKELNVGETNYTQMKDSNNTNSSNQGSNNNTNQSGITQVNKTVKIYIPEGGVTGMGIATSPTAETYSSYMPKGTSTVYIISENTKDGLSYIKYNGHYGYVNTIVLTGAENNYSKM